MPDKFFYKKSFLWRTLLIAAVFCGLSLYIVYSNPQYAPWISAVFLAIAAYYAFKSVRFLFEIFTPRPVIEIGPEGIVDRRTIGTRPLPFPQISAIVQISRSRGLFVVANENSDLSAYGMPLARISNMVRKKMGRPGAVFMLTPALALDAGHDDLIATLKSQAKGHSIRFEVQGAA